MKDKWGIEVTDRNTFQTAMLKSSQEKGWILYMSEKAKVYFSKEISPEKVLEMYQLLGKKLDGKVAIKLHSGEAGNQNFLKPEFWKPVIDYVGGTVVECNTAYEGERNTCLLYTSIMKLRLHLRIPGYAIISGKI